MGDKSIRKNEKKKKKADLKNVVSTSIKSVVTQPELIKKNGSVK